MSRRYQGGESSEILGQNTVKNEDMFQCRHEVGTVNDSDKAVPLSVIQSCPVATCETAGGTAAKVGVVNNFSDFTLLNGREVLVYFASGNTADNPTFNLNNTGAFPLALENQLSTVSIGSGCWGDGVFLHLKYVDVTVSNTRIQKWIICGHRIASQSSTQTTYADGQGRTNTVASGNMQSVTSNAVYNSLGGTLKLFKKLTKTINSYGSWEDIVNCGYDIEEANQGLYAVRVVLNDHTIWFSENLSTVIFLFCGATNSGNASPVYFNQCGHANNVGQVQLRMSRHPSTATSLNFCKLQININTGNSEGVVADVYLYRIS